LTSHVKYLLENPQELQTGKYKKAQTRGKFFSDRRNDAEKALNYLTFLAEHLPERQREKVFDKTTLEPLIRAILTSFQETNGRLKNKRVLRIALMLMLEGENCAWNLLPGEEVGMLMDRSFDKARIIHTISHFLDIEEKREKITE
jgi:hypothetical protein